MVCAQGKQQQKKQSHGSSKDNQKRTALFTHTYSLASEHLPWPAGVPKRPKSARLGSFKPRFGSRLLRRPRPHLISLRFFGRRDDLDRAAASTNLLLSRLGKMVRSHRQLLGQFSRP